MKFKELYAMQEQLDSTIHSLHNVDYESTLVRRIMAFNVELGEFANETRCFKFWSLKGPSPRDVMLEEYVDGVHFVLSIGLALKCDVDHDFIVDSTSEDKTEVFLDVYKKASIVKDDPNLENYYELFTRFLKLGVLCGFSEQEIYDAYLEKNKINYQRQENKY